MEIVNSVLTLVAKAIELIDGATQNNDNQEIKELVEALELLKDSVDKLSGVLRETK